MSENGFTAPRPSIRFGQKPDQQKLLPPGGAIVFGGNYRALGLVRSLGRHGIPVWVLTDEHTLAGYSRYASRRMAWPREEIRRLEFLHLLCRHYSLEGWALFPTSDGDVSFVARHSETLSSHFRLTVPAWDVLQWAFDKRLTHQLAEEMGIGHPATYYPRDREQVAALECQFPVILKPAFKEGFNAFVHAKAWQVNNRNELLLRYEQACAMVSSDIIMVQEVIPGDGRTQFSYAALCTEGQPRVSLVARRTRQYPVDFGRSSTLVETVDEPDVEQASIPLLAALHYTGLMEVEFKRDPRNGQLKLLDMNPRVWGWHTLSRRFGGDFPYLYWQLLHDQDVPTARVPSGVRWVRAVTDTMAVLSELWHGRMTLIDYIRSLKRPLEHAILAADDPLPALLEATLLAQVVLRRKAF